MQSARVEADTCNVGVGERDLSDEIALRGANVDGGFVIPLWELAGDRYVSAAAEAGHGFEESAEAFGIGVERGEEAGVVATCLVLRLSGLQGGIEVPRTDRGGGSPSRFCCLTHLHRQIY
jgi:hypothetical protein